ncbi:MAG TPA: helix-turn-helix domain-containing protein [Anaerolineales bacterium]|nr:helix-turn-helix domain-containing protein [Anaerolineales bacterium]
MQEEISFGGWLRKQRRAMDLTRQALADKVGCAEVTLRRIEAGTLKPSKELASILLEKLGIPEAERPRWISFARGLSGFPLPSNSPKKPKSNLPAPITSFIGREKEQTKVNRLIAKHRLVTLTGPGGVGKTRLSLKVGEQILGNYDDGVWLVELASILDPLLIPHNTAIAVGLRDAPQRPVIDMLCDYLREKKMLVILDNCEHLLDACAQLADVLLKRCPSLKILATSRETLGILGEAVYQVPSLELPDFQQLIENIRGYESIKLFEERAQLAQINFSLTTENAYDVAKICRRLDGIPLAIELAAARISTFSPEQIETRLQESLSLLSTGNRTALPRHQTLQATINWSHDLLTPAEQTLFRRLSIFVGGWTLEAAEFVCSDGDIKSEAILNLLAQLIHKSLVLVEETDIGSRYRMLETVRQYASEKLIASGERDTLCDRHLEYFLHLAETASPHLIRPEQLEWLNLLDTDYENLRLAFKSSLGKETAKSSMIFCAALRWYWIVRCYWLEGLSWVTRALEEPGQEATQNEKVVRVKALYTKASLQWKLGRFEQLLSSAQASLTLALEVSEKKDIAIARYYVGVGLLWLSGSEYERAVAMIEESLANFQELNDIFWQAQVFPILTQFLAGQGNRNWADVLSKSVELGRAAGERLTLAEASSDLARFLFDSNQVGAARQYAEESDQLYEQIGAGKASLNSQLFAQIAWLSGEYAKARALYLELQERCRFLGDRYMMVKCQGNLGILAMEEGHLAQAQVEFEKALALSQHFDFKPVTANCMIELSKLFYMQGNFEAFKRYVRECLALRNYLGESQKPYILLTILISLSFRKPEIAAQLLGVIDYFEKLGEYPFRPIEQRYRASATLRIRNTLSEAIFNSFFIEGQKLSVDEALDLALKAVEDM